MGVRTPFITGRGTSCGVWGSSRCFSVFFVPEVFDGCEYLLMRIWRLFGGILI